MRSSGPILAKIIWQCNVHVEKNLTRLATKKIHAYLLVAYEKNPWQIPICVFCSLTHWA